MNPQEILVEADTLPDAYHSALRMLNRFGSIVKCPDWDQTNGVDGTQLEASVTMCVNHPLQEPMISRLFPGGQRELQQYMMEMLDGILDFEVDAGNWEYTYHRRMTQFVAQQEYITDEILYTFPRYVNQIEFVINELKRNQYSRRAVIDIRDNSYDMFHDSPACLQHIQYFIRDGSLDCKVLFRSNDACKAAFMNAFALIMLQKRIADALGVEMGSYTHRANSFHCYSKDYPLFKGYIERINNNPQNTTYCYVGEWKDEMDDYIEDIMESVKELKARSGVL